jgi:hypothetical protein
MVGLFPGHFAVALLTPSFRVSVAGVSALVIVLAVSNTASTVVPSILGPSTGGANSKKVM